MDIILFTPTEKEMRVRLANGTTDGLREGLEGKIKGLDETVILTWCDEYNCEGTTMATEKDLRIHRKVVFLIKE